MTDAVKKRSAWALIRHEGRFLFTQRSATTSRPGQWCPPGGGVQSAELPEDACVREVREEVGLVVRVVEQVCEDGGFCYFLCELVRRPPVVVLAPRECSDFRWVEPGELLQLGAIMELSRMQRVFLRLASPIRLEP